MTKRIIHADNSDFFRKIVKSLLTEEGYATENTDSGAATLQYIEDGSAEAVIMGMALKDMSSEELIKKIVLLPNKIPTIILTSNDDDSEKERLLRMGFTAYISKSEKWQEELLKALSKT